MPLTKAQKALYEAAIRRKGLPLGKAEVQHAKDFIGPRRISTGHRLTTDWREFPGAALFPRDYVQSGKVPMSYFEGQGRNQDLYDELLAASNEYRYTTPGMESYMALKRQPWAMPSGRRYLDRMPDTETMGYGYEDPSAYFYRPMSSDEYRSLTALGEEELEAQFEADLIEGYKRYLRQMYEGKIAPRPDRYEVEFFDPAIDRWDDRMFNNVDDATSYMGDIRGKGMKGIRLRERPTDK